MGEQTALVTGAAGFIGSHTVEALAAAGYRVVGIDNFCDFYDRQYKQANVDALGEKLRLHEGDITDRSIVDEIIQTHRPSVIIHLAAMAGVRPSMERPAHYARVNVEGTTNLLEAARLNGVKKFIFASSSSVYGNAPKVPFSETDCVDEPISPYAATKRAGELICHTYWHLYKLPCFCLRFFTVFGPRQRPDLAIYKFVKLIDSGLPVPFFGDGSTSRDYTYISDIVAGIMAAVDRCDRFRIYNLGGSHPISLADLVSEIEKALGKSAMLNLQPMQAGDVERTFADVARAQAELGYKPQVSIREGIQRFVDWYRSKAR